MKKIMKLSCTLLALLILIGVLSVPVFASVENAVSPISSYPSSCQDIRDNNPTAADGNYIILSDSHVITVYCDNMDNAPTEYLSFVETGGTSNYSLMKAGGAYPGTDVVSHYDKVRFDPTVVGIIHTDTTFSTSTGEIKGNTETHYATASSCDWSPSGKANADLTGTSLTFAPGQFYSDGWPGPQGTITYSAGDQIVNLTGGNYCGHSGPIDSFIQLNWQYQALEVSATQVNVDGESTITATLKNAVGLPVANETIRFDSSLGSITTASQTDANGVVSALLSMPNAGGTALIEAVSDTGGSYGAVTVDMPVVSLTGSGDSVTFYETLDPVAVDSNITLTGVTFDGAKVSISQGFISGSDELLFENQNGINGSFDASSGILSLHGTASAQDYQTALRSVKFRNLNGSSFSTASEKTINISIGESTLYNEGNGHFYEFVEASAITWTDAKNAAENSSLYGLQGYLATVTSSTENAFITQKLKGNGWIGASDARSENTWEWVTGPEAGTIFYQISAGQLNTFGQYNNWGAGEPNDYYGEDYAHFYGNGIWNDFPHHDVSIVGYVVEYGGMAGDPQISLTATSTINLDAKPTAEVNYSITIPTNTDVIATITPSETVTITNNGGSASYTFSENGSFTFEFVGSGGVTGEVEAMVSNIDKTAPVITVGSFTTIPTNQDVVVTVETDEGTLNAMSHTFTENGEFTFTATDVAGNVTNETVTITNIDKTAPVTTASTNIGANDHGWFNEEVTVALTPTDNLSGVANTFYSVDGAEAQSGTSIIVSSEGNYVITYWSVDEAGNVEAEQTLDIHIDTTVPELNVTLDITTLWSPNHKLVDITVETEAAGGLSDLESIVLTSITSNELDYDPGTVDDDVAGDIQGAAFGESDTTFQLRSERSGEGTGRVYTITYTATDKAGNQTSATAVVEVPHDKGNNKDVPKGKKK